MQIGQAAQRLTVDGYAREIQIDKLGERGQTVAIHQRVRQAQLSQRFTFREAFETGIRHSGVCEVQFRERASAAKFRDSQISDFRAGQIQLFQTGDGGEKLHVGIGSLLGRK